MTRRMKGEYGLRFRKARNKRTFTTQEERDAMDKYLLQLRGVVATKQLVEGQPFDTTWGFYPPEQRLSARSMGARRAQWAHRAQWSSVLYRSQRMLPFREVLGRPGFLCRSKFCTSSKKPLVSKPLFGPAGSQRTKPRWPSTTLARARRGSSTTTQGREWPAASRQASEKGAGCTESPLRWCTRASGLRCSNSAGF